MTASAGTPPNEPTIVLSHVTPWGFVVALPLALVFAYLGASAIDAELLPNETGQAHTGPLWLFSVPLVGFALFLFLVGVGELASWLKPSVEVVMDEKGIATFGIAGERRLAWGDVSEASLGGGQVTLRGKIGTDGSTRVLRLHFNRLEAEPAAVIAAILRHRPDLAEAPGTPLPGTTPRHAARSA